MATGRPHPANTHKGEERGGPGIHLTHNSTREDNAKAGVAGESTQPATDAKMFMRIMNKRHVRAAIAACFSAAQDRTPPHPLSPSLCSRFVAAALKSVGCQAQARSRLQAQYAMRIMCVKAKISPIANGEGHKHTHSHTHTHTDANKCIRISS